MIFCIVRNKHYHIVSTTDKGKQNLSYCLTNWYWNSEIIIWSQKLILKFKNSAKLRSCDCTAVAQIKQTVKTFLFSYTDFSHLLSLAWCITMKLLNYLGAKLIMYLSDNPLISQLKTELNYYWATFLLYYTPIKFPLPVYTCNNFIILLETRC